MKISITLEEIYSLVRKEYRLADDVIIDIDGIHPPATRDPYAWQEVPVDWDNAWVSDHTLIGECVDVIHRNGKVSYNNISNSWQSFWRQDGCAVDIVKFRKATGEGN